MSYKVKVVYSPFNELLVSFLMYKRPKNLKYLAVGTEWLNKVKTTVSKDLLEEIDQLKDIHFFDLVDLLVEEIEEKPTIEGIFRYLKKMSAGDMYVKVAQASKHGKVAIPPDIEEDRDTFLKILSQWNEEYFSTLPSSVLTKLQDAYEVDKELVNELQADQVVERLAHGLQIETNEVKTVYLMPTYHMYPLNTFALLKNQLFVYYPARTLDNETDRIVTIAKALSDPNRLQILKYLHENKLSFTDLVQKTNTTKGNIHHHITILLTARLIQKHVVENCNILYSSRSTIINELNNRLASLLAKES